MKNNKQAICTKKVGGCGRSVEECKCPGNGAHPWDCMCTRCTALQTTGKFPQR